MIVVIGGGAAGIFAALAAKQASRASRVVVLEKSAVLLAKVKVSGGGRCNVTHACFDPHELVKHYPRGSRELLGPFHRFQPRDTVEWFESRGVPLKTEADGRMFPTTDSSSTIITALLQEAERLGVEIKLRQQIERVEPKTVIFKDGTRLACDKMILATGSSRDGYGFAESLGHTIVPPVPSLFTFNMPNSPLKELSGIALTAKVSIVGLPYTQTAPLLITHFGFSGPAILKLSAWAARELHDKNYQFDITIDWLPSVTTSVQKLKESFPQKNLETLNPYHLPKNLWRYFVQSYDRPLAHLTKGQAEAIEQRLHRDLYRIDGKTTHKEEFVTCGGVSLKEIDFQTMESKVAPGHHFAGEVLNIDGVTGGFNFQNAWTTGYVAGFS